ncbi:CHASE2 domain-containing protein [Anabaena cylindrica FACHB-243]|uniref:Serine/threonine protein kinase with Chase2 sensor n=1 Tax=Anabaena cylindrica (strain ATCC 27899 / PCC 7122) TaxID=272123 RepID=K9ZPH7_ANACC|nr:MULTISPECIES: CHASE2 domain-containing protein [Anabaena]AFZ60684.1 serine/threonine protein kinase with Chase2 sensor [Anabaena cylindrica PCC 7122]MBD2419534.1 CHASE2 domain-containing protein [Anabaena cylindrica FACHB-243]MBY5282768.1 CHASE2 domain-containing protein [Anabaena sp. CCAP 1446/1C]MBY5309105.1 CHASE2 domain-containing protein [Anabaena sp. CCAP 1446/1C]MCM2409728.1 CHASE2 domain-containing protein [Anabaena sp. CCAP 1446/1C]
MFNPGLIIKNRYRVIKQIGQGGFGKTFEIDDRGKIKVLKVLDLKNFSNSSQRQTALSLFMREASVLMQLNHPGIPKVDNDGYFIWTHSTDEQYYCLVMEKIHGENLKDWMHKRNMQPINQDLAVDWLNQLLIILNYLHQNQYFHRDIKPANIIIKPDGKLVLIDFGAVREITYTLLHKLAASHDITILISPEGYTPQEQINGKALPQSDLFALGRTMVFLLTGLIPAQLPQEEVNDELIWRNKAPQISSEFADLIDNLIAVYPQDRPSNIEEIKKTLSNLIVLEKRQENYFLNKIKHSKLNNIYNIRLLYTMASQVLITSIVIGIRSLGWLHFWELKAFDQFLSLRPLENKDDRILLVTAGESEISKYKYPLPDEILLKVLQTLESYQPEVIGLNIYRDFPIKNDAKLLLPQWQNNQKLITTCFVSGKNSPEAPGISPPFGVPEARISFNDGIEDADGIYRRNLLFLPLVSSSKCSTRQSLSFVLAERYLQAQGIYAQTTADGYLQLGNAIFKPLKLTPGMYLKSQLGGEQILLNFRQTKNIADTVSISELLEGKVKSNLVKGRIVLIGMTDQNAPKFKVPDINKVFSDGEISALTMQAHMTSQILSTVIDHRILLSVWTQWSEIAWIHGWSILGSLLAWHFRSWLELYIGICSLISILYILCYIIFSQGFLIPLLPSALGLISTSLAGLLLKNSTNKAVNFSSLVIGK